MDCVMRQTSQHVVYEPEWEGAFNLQLKLSDIITIVQDWCATDVSCRCTILYQLHSKQVCEIGTTPQKWPVIVALWLCIVDLCPLISFGQG